MNKAQAQLYHQTPLQQQYSTTCPSKKIKSLTLYDTLQILVTSDPSTTAPQDQIGLSSSTPK
jgi:hypothetical protein